MSKINRRLFMGGTAVALAGGISFKVLTTEHEEVASSRSAEVEDARAVDLRTTFHYLSFSDDVMRSFLRALDARGGQPSEGRVRELFLLSTDFFAQGADERKQLSFVALYDPFLNPCYNPMEQDG